MRSYRQFCPVAKAAELFCERWTALIIRDLAAGATRFSEIKRGVPLMSPTLLSRRLKELEAEGVVERRRRDAGRGWTYHLTPAGHEFAPLIDALAVWGRRWARRDLQEDEIDLGLLLWTLERSTRADAFGNDRSVVRLELTDQPPAKRLWWFLNEAGQVELCLEDPGFDVTLYLSCTLPSIIHVVRGDIGLRQAQEDGQLEAHGSRADCRALARWLNLGPWSRVESARADTGPA